MGVMYTLQKVERINYKTKEVKNKMAKYESYKKSMKTQGFKPMSMEEWRAARSHQARRSKGHNK